MKKKRTKVLIIGSILLVICICIKFLFFRNVQYINKEYTGFYINNVTKENLGECSIQIKGISREVIITIFDNYPPNLTNTYGKRFNGFITIDGSKYPFSGRAGQKDDGSLSTDHYILSVKNSVKENEGYGISIYNNLSELYFQTSTGDIYESFNKEIVWATSEKVKDFNDIIDKLPPYYQK
ncbi:hypothetical protein [Clostridium intestinale]|uniref:Uncharacterized protein n=1 Tax=Clostridium intestinale DSM 6191 TaxID=1121320 RepID=A0A1M6A3Q3_9CLOT|nr:hypothetical protein [Clostridium intestinale]SHI31144.1 hypothetical protein SAMN02745941_03603 [Clostridium intestinale DSM 6191]